MAKSSGERHSARKPAKQPLTKRESESSRQPLLAIMMDKGTGPIEKRKGTVFKVGKIERLGGGAMRIEVKEIRRGSPINIGSVSGTDDADRSLEPQRPFAKFVPVTLPEPYDDLRGVLWGRLERMTQALVEPSPDQNVELARQAELRARRFEAFEKSHGLLTATQVADLSGSESGNRYATATRWLRAGRIFAVTLHAQQRFPGFQFDDGGNPKPVIAEVLRRLPFQPPGWATALWFDTPHFALPAHARPAELLDRNPELVIQAAEHTASEHATEWL